MLEIRYLGHSAVWLSDGKTKVVIDPFLTGNPLAPVGVGEVQADLILVTHAHGDHWGDAVPLSKKGGVVVSTFEIATYAERHGAKSVPMNLGGTYRFPGGWLKWTPAWHSSSFPDGTYGGMPMGVVVELGGKRVYHAGDTALFSDMRLIGELGLDLAFLPIGDHFTMGPEDALKALELLRPKKVVPIHYNTFPPIRQDGEAFARKAAEKGVEGHALKPGGVLVLE
ncbi:metal-dependent hydrolase [Thermus caliditerrae]|uniref:metal-dependent hydrolase n=1 Tax=Thermus caliditerrae TaxID=1330700 RepID=UPI001F3EAFA9|nr:metal-dependent hydrolase [Thermus caliditerrae]